MRRNQPPRKNVHGHVPKGKRRRTVVRIVCLGVTTIVGLLYVVRLYLFSNTILLLSSSYDSTTNTKQQQHQQQLDKEEVTLFHNKSVDIYGDDDDKTDNHPMEVVLYPPMDFHEQCSNELISIPTSNRNDNINDDDDPETGCCKKGRSFHFGNTSPSILSSLFDDNDYRIRNVSYYVGAPFGNMLTYYYNERALAYLMNETFVADTTKTTAAALKGIINCFPIVARPYDVSPFYLEDELNIVRDQLQKKSGPKVGSHGYPHTSGDAAFHLIPKLISAEVRSIVQAWSAIPTIQRKPGVNTVVAHLRCDQYILDKHDDYGIVPHRFILDRITPSTEELVIVRKKENKDNACKWSFRDLMEQASIRFPGLKVFVRMSNDPERDWLYLAQASTLVCSPSSFCLTAAWGNPNSVYFPTCGGKSTLAVPNRVLQDISQQANMSLPNFHWVSMDFLPGTTANKMDRSAIISYARSTSCNTELYGCIMDAYSLETGPHNTQLFIQSPLNSCTPLRNPKRLELLHITKTGGSTLEVLAAQHNVSWGACHFLGRVDGMPGSMKCPNPHQRMDSFKSSLQGIQLWHAPPRFLNQEEKMWLSNATLFTVVRNPYDRVVSSWNYLFGRVDNNATAMNEWLTEMLTAIYNGRRIPIGHLGISRQEFLIPQTDYIDDTVEVLRLETLQQDFACLMRRHGLDWEWVEERRNKSGPDTLTTDDLTVANQALIELVYRKDFVQLGYPMRP